MSQPGRNAARPIARKFRLAAIGIEQSQKETAIRATLQKLDSIRANAGVPRTEPPRQLRMTPRRDRLFQNQKIIPTGMSLHKLHHSSFYSLHPIPYTLF
jgi:hypothetical protein